MATAERTSCRMASASTPSAWARTVRAQAENIDADQILGELLQAVPIP